MESCGHTLQVWNPTELTLNGRLWEGFGGLANWKSFKQILVWDGFGILGLILHRRNHIADRYLLFNVSFARIGRCKAMIFHSMWWPPCFQALRFPLFYRNFTLPRSSKSRKKDSLATSISTWISCYLRNWGNRGNTEVVGFNFLFQTENTSKNIEYIYIMIFMISFSNQRFC